MKVLHKYLPAAIEKFHLKNDPLGKTSLEKNYIVSGAI